MWYFATAGRGTESFVLKELNEKFHILKSYQIDGKVFFELDDVPFPKLHLLKSVERLFVMIIHDEDFRMRNRKGISNLFKHIEAIQNWSLYLETWQAYQSTCSVDCHLVARNGTVPHSSELCESKTENGVHSSSSNPVETFSEPTVKKTKLSDDVEVTESGITFRISCKCSGIAAKWFDTQYYSRVIGAQLSKSTGWAVNLKKPKLEVVAQLNNSGLVIGLSLSARPLSQRPYLSTVGLRSTTGWILSHLANIQPGDIVLDPMCGTGNILLEASKSWPNCTYLGCDVDANQVAMATENVRQAGESSRVQLFQADVTQLRLNHCVNKVVSDVPFGINCGSVDEAKQLYPEMIIAIDRVLTPGGHVVLLTSGQLKEYLLSQVREMNTTHVTVETGKTLDDDGKEQHYQWSEKEVHYLKLGETHAYACLFVKESVESK